MGFLFKGNVLLARSYCGLCCPNRGEISFRVSKRYKGFLDRYEDSQLSTTTQSTKGKHEFFCISSKRVVPVKYSRQKDSITEIPIVNQASGKLVSTYFRVSRAYLHSLRSFCS